VPQTNCGCAQSVPTLAGLSNGHRGGRRWPGAGGLGQATREREDGRDGDGQGLLFFRLVAQLLGLGEVRFGFVRVTQLLVSSGSIVVGQCIIGVYSNGLGEISNRLVMLA